MRWGGNMRALVLLQRDDPAQLHAARALTLADFGVRESDPGHASVPSLLMYTDTPAPDATRASDTWTPKQLAYAGTARPDVAGGVLAKAYDLIVNLSPADFPPFDFLCAAATAHLRAAGHDAALHAYDVVLAPPAAAPETAQHPTPFLARLRAYLRALQPPLPHG